MSKESSTWHSPRLDRDVTVVRYGTVGTPVLLFPTAAGDAEEAERFHLIDALGSLLEAGRVKCYSVDAVAGTAWMKENNRTPFATDIQNRYDAFIYSEVVPAIRTDCKTDDIEIVVAGASIGAFEALASICRHPDVFSKAICMSGTFTLEKFIEGDMNRDWWESSPLHFVPEMPEDEKLARLRERFVLITHGTGRWEEPAQSWRVAQTLGGRGIPNRVDEWSSEWDHDWPTWRVMLPKYLDEMVA